MQRETWREKRSTTIRLDYAKLHSTGERVVLDDNTPESTSREQSESEYETAVESEAESDLSGQFSSLLSLHSSYDELDSPEVTLNQSLEPAVEAALREPVAEGGIHEPAELEELVQEPAVEAVLEEPVPIHELPDLEEVVQEPAVEGVLEGAVQEPEIEDVAEAVPAVLVVENLPVMAAREQLDVEQLTVSEDIDDFLEENEIEDIDTEEFEQVGKRAEELRTLYRTVHNKLKTLLGAQVYADEYQAAATEKLDAIKQYIKGLKKARKDYNENVNTKDNDSKSNKFEFLKKEFETMAAGVEKQFILDDSKWSSVDDQQLTKRKESVDDDAKTISQMHDLIKDIMDVSTNKAELQIITDRYEKILTDKTTYSTKLYDEYKNRQIEERKAFDKAKLSIKLPKFKGYVGVDIYTFRSDFEKLHIKTTPKEFLPDLLKNNYLENPALLLVKDVKDVDEIWKRLKEAYGDCKILLSNKVAELNKVAHLSPKSNNDPETVIEGLSSIIHLMKDLMQLAEDHSIEERLFHGGAMDRIQELMGDARFTRWLSASYEKDLNDEKTRWIDLLAFLEKEVKVNQQRLMFSSKLKKKAPPPADRSGDRSNNRGSKSSDSSHHQSDGNVSPCFICGATDHVPTNGPKGSKLIQYFVCKKFVEMSNAERLAALKSKKLCIQCLYPGADCRTQKHKEGKCQREFICKHPSHNQYDCKKHVLVCDDHKADAQNIATFNDYKQRCINRQNQVPLPDFSKKILIHHVQEELLPSTSPPSLSQSVVPQCTTDSTEEAVHAADPTTDAAPSNGVLPVCKGFSIPVPQKFLPAIPEEEETETETSANSLSTSAEPAAESTNHIAQAAAHASGSVTLNPVASSVSSSGDSSNSSDSSETLSQIIAEASAVIPLSVSEPVVEPVNQVAQAGASAVSPSGTSNVDRSDNSPEMILNSSIWEGWEDVADEEPIYILQKIIVDNEFYNLFYDSGCKNFVSRYLAILRLRHRARQTRPGPTTIVGVGGMQMETPHGYYSICLPRRDGTKAFLTGICLDVITETFPTYPLQGEVENDIKNAFVASGGDSHALPVLEPEVGGDTDFMLGMKFNRHFPTEVYRCPVTGLSMYRSQFKNASGGYGVVGGNHRVFTAIENFHHTNFNWTFLALQKKVNFFRTQVNPDVGLLGIRPESKIFNFYMDEEIHKSSSIQSRLKRFEDSQFAGSEIQYRCPRCRACNDCKRCEKTISIKEEVEQDLIERSVHVDIENGVAIAELPFTGDPSVKLAPNRNIALKVYHQQVKSVEERRLS